MVIIFCIGACSDTPTSWVDVGELEDFFDDGKYRHDGFALMIIGILDHVLALKEFMWH